jgi:hypothetical protein
MYPTFPPVPPAPPQPKPCPHCGKPMEASTPAQPAPTMPAQATPPPKTYESWRDRDPLL